MQRGPDGGGAFWGVWFCIIDIVIAWKLDETVMRWAVAFKREANTT